MLKLTVEICSILKNIPIRNPHSLTLEAIICDVSVEIDYFDEDSYTSSKLSKTQLR